jgi:lipopolysaccharide/colanic/teichoic acid biosynthesis glycosyltransferase
MKQPVSASESITPHSNPLTSRTPVYNAKPWLPVRAYKVCKRLMDLAIAVAVLPLVLPVLATCAILIKIDSPDGPVLFVQERTGRGGRRFRMYKFRTMRPNAEELKKTLFAVNADGELASPVKLENDPRVTCVGNFLRKTSLDELPQVINILKGEMSWVGPRPTSFGLKSYTLWQTERLDVIPGLTGLWQIYGRGSTDFADWVRWDVRYLEQRCLWLDVQILIRTAGAVLNRKGAH